MKTWQQRLRRFILDERYKHMYMCHPKFSLRRGTEFCQVLWDNRVIAKIRYAHQLQGQYSGSCFMIATGPSLNQFDLSACSAYHSISLNLAIHKFNSQHIKPTHCLIIDRRVFENEWPSIVASIQSGANCFFSFEGLSIIAERDPGLFNHQNIFLIESASRKFGIQRYSVQECIAKFSQQKDFYLDQQLLSYCRSIGFSSNLKKGLFSGKTVATWGTQLAYALGYQNVFIAGMDLGGTGKQHFYAEQKNGAPDFLKDYEPHIRACFELAAKVALEKGWGLYNLSAQSTLPDAIVKKISIDTALKIAQNSANIIE
jgi:Kdo-III transferase WaaZ